MDMMDMKMREHKSQILPQCGSPERGSSERGATLLEVGLATALIAIALVGLSQIYASRNEFRQDQAESGFFHILAKEVGARASVSNLIADLSEGESRILNSAGLLEAGLISELEKTSFHIEGEEMEAVLFVTKGRGSAFRLALGLAAMGDWTLDDEKAEALQRFLTLASFEGGYFRAASGAGGLRPMMDPDRAMTAADRARALWLDYADALTDQKALADSTIPITELETGRYSEGKILAVLSGTKTSALEGGRSVRLRESPVITGSKTTKRITGSYTGTGEWLDPFKMPLSYNLAKRIAEGWKLKLMEEGETVEDLSVSPITCPEGERAVAIAAPKDLYASFLGDSGKSAAKKLDGETSIESNAFPPADHDPRCDEPNRYSRSYYNFASYCSNRAQRRLSSGVGGYKEERSNLFEMQRTFPEEMLDDASLGDLSEADKASLRRQLEERYGVDYAHRRYGAFGQKGFTATQEGFQRRIDGSKAARNGAGASTPELERTITTSTPLRMNGVIRLSDGSYVAGGGASNDLAENGGLNLGLVYDKERLSDAQAAALLAKLQDNEGFIKRIWENLDNSRTDRMTARYQNKYKNWCDNSIPRDRCDRLASSLGGNHASYVVAANSIISEIETARLAYTDTAQAQLTALESVNINGGRIFKQSGRFYSIPLSGYYTNRAPPANLPATGNRGYHRILPSNQAMSASDSRTGQWLYDRMCLEAYRTIQFKISPTRWNTGWTRPRDYSAACGSKNAFSMMNINEDAFPLDGLTQETTNAIKNRTHNFNMYSRGGGHLGLKAERDTSGSGWHILSLVNGYFFSTAATTAQLDQMITDQHSIAAAYGPTKTRLQALRTAARLDVNLDNLRQVRDNRWKVSRLLDEHRFQKLALDALRQDSALASAFEEDAVQMVKGAAEPKLAALHALGDAAGDATSVAPPRHVIPVALNHFKKQMKCDANGRCSNLNEGTGPGQFRPGQGIHEEGRMQWRCPATRWLGTDRCIYRSPPFLRHVGRPGHGGRSHTAGMEVIYPDNLIHKKAVCVPVADAP